MKEQDFLTTIQNKDMLFLGSGFDCDIRIDDPSISLRHLGIKRLPNGHFQIQDIDSDFGTFIRGKRVLTPQMVTLADTIQIGLRPVPISFIASHFKDKRQDRSNQTVLLSTKSFVVGRESPADIIVAQPVVSRRHLEIKLDPTGVSIRDLQSSNGTFVNSVRLSKKWLLITVEDSLFMGTYRVPKADVKNWFSLLEGASDFYQKKNTFSLDFSKNGNFVIGRNPKCDFPIDNPTISWNHAKLSINDSTWTITDLNSCNGVFVDGQKIRKATLTENQTLRIGGISFPLFQKEVKQEIKKSIRLDAVELNRVLPGGKSILEDVSFSVYPGEMVALMGPSGAGKTTLLEILTGQKKPSKGQVFLNNKDLYSHFGEFRDSIGYVPQEDIMYRDLTVYEVLYHSAKMRLPSDLPDSSIIQSVEKLLTQMGLAHIRDSMVGGDKFRGISGGQRKRVNIAMELITEPSLLFLDEPTSGLDSSSALDVLQVLRRLAEEGKTIIMTIHQPRVEAYNLIDQLILLAKGGKLAYFGPADATSYFEKATYRKRSPEVNPADFIMDMLENVQIQKTPEEWRDLYKFSTLHARYVTARLGTINETKALHTHVVTRSSLSQFTNLFRRYTKRKLRDRNSLLIQLLQAPIIAALLAILFTGQGTELVDKNITPSMEKLPILIQTMQLQNGIHPTLFLICAAAFWFGCSNVAREIVSETSVFLREIRGGLRILSYFASIFAYQMLLATIQTFTIAVLVWLFVGLSANLFLLWGILLLTASCGITTGLFISSISKTEVMAISLIPLLLLPQLLLGGYIKLYGHMQISGWQNRIADLMPIRWSFEAMTLIEYEAFLQKNEHLRLLEEIIGFTNQTPWLAVVILIGLTIFFGAFTLVALKRNAS